MDYDVRVVRRIPPRRPRARSISRVVATGAALVFTLTTALLAQYQGWDIPAGGKDERSPLTTSPALVEEGAGLFREHCARCHGTSGRGDGQDSDHAADLTDDLRTDLNTEGVLFYKVWNGHAIQLRTRVDDMPAFSSRLTRVQVWTLVEYLKQLRTPSAEKQR